MGGGPQNRRPAIYTQRAAPDGQDVYKRQLLKVESNDRVTLSRSGASKSQLIIERGVRHQCHYDTGYGAMTIGVSGDRIVSHLDDNGGRLEFAYSLDVNTLLASENAVYINAVSYTHLPLKKHLQN